jgi:methyl-accepting chemotaxis protein PixJ
MESSTEEVVMGTKLVDETRQSLDKITAASAQMSQLVKAITQATTMQFEASETVAQTVKDMAMIAAKTSTEAEHVSASFEQLRQVAQTLQADVAQFKVD